MDEQNTGYISFNEFRNYFSKVISHWSSLINTHVKIDKKKLTAIFSEIDSSGDGIIDFNEYSSALERNPNLLDWFTLLNNGGDERTVPSPANKKQIIEKPETPKQKEPVIDKNHIAKIVEIHSLKQQKDDEVKELKQEINNFHEQTTE